ncbi:hypothetical protein K431DRAFT_137931 [Polychaeton citri CBS 116435]|uniref:C2H2-type domain-containing protein n=1 Tax=Polychaeton citri CBS 116435 TaxID=1314669 RepID=A0A9P4Q2N8_9PEZI|nr:hypothetical protein K431DRAFT_137931 [Polychaeton citri CBS 116435]
MTASKEMSRPTSQHRPASGIGSGPSSLPRYPHSRTHSHSISTASLSASHRISRRKSSSFAPNANAAAIGAAVEQGVSDGSVAINRRTSLSRAALGSLNEGAFPPPMPNSLPQHMPSPDHRRPGASAVVDGPSLSSFDGLDQSTPKLRRASEGAGLSKKEKNAAGELKCEHCGKAYKHGSCLNKHLWEHTPQWQYTSKLLISKHQQVQLLEAASVLVAMNIDAKENTESDNSSSPAASGSSDMRDDDLSSTETTPPPHAEDKKRFSNSSSAYSRSFQSTFSESAPNYDGGFGHYRQWSSSSNRPTTGHTSIAESYKDEDPADLAAAVGLLSCSYGTPKHGPTSLPPDVPPVPPLPAKYQGLQTATRGAYGGFSRHEDVDMHDEDDEDESSDDEPPRRHHSHEVEVDEGMFGRMDA